MPNIIYDAQITNNTNDEHKEYLGAAEASFKERYSNHTQDFKHKKYMKCTKLSKYIWSLNCNLLNRGSELVSKYRHQNKLLLCNVKRNDSIDWYL